MMREMSARALGLSFLLAAVVGCADSVEVFEPARAAVLQDAAPRDPDEGLAGGTLPGEPMEPRGVDAGADSRTSTGSPCGQCGGVTLCSVDRCVEAQGITALDAWVDHTCVVYDGRLFCWGRNDAGELGLGDRDPHSGPSRVGSWNDWLAVAAGEEHTCAIRSPGELYCWGRGDEGQLGLGDTLARLAPTRVGVRRDWASVACGGDSCCAIDGDSRMFCWGENLEGKPGQADPYGTPDITVPSEVAGGALYRAMGIGQGHACAIRVDGALECWGRNGLGELGTGSEQIQVRDLVEVGPERDWLQVAASQHHTCAVRETGALYCWGDNAHLELGSGEAAGEGSRTPLRVGDDSDWAQVSVGWFHTCAIKRDGALFCWGRAIEGQLGQGGSIDPVGELTAVEVPARFERVTAGRFFTCGVSSEGQLYCWGANDKDQLGLGDDMRRHEPALVEF